MQPALVLAIAVAVRVHGSIVTTMPGRDGVAYLWLAEQYADGRLAAVGETVFHPLYPLLIAPLLWLALEPFAAGQAVALGAGALATLPLWALTRRLFDERAAGWAALMYAIGAWFVRHPAECMSEGPFYLLAAGWAAALLAERSRPAAAGAIAGLAFLTRPEGFALAVTGALWLLVNGRRRPAALHLMVAALVAALLPVALNATGQGVSLTPKAMFNWQVGAGGADSALSHYLWQWLRWPGDAWEGLGYVVFPLIVVGAIRYRPRRIADQRLCLLLPFLAQLAVVPLLKSHHRFVSGFGVLLLPFAGAALAAMLTTLRARGRFWPIALVAILLASEAKQFVTRPADRTIERELGRWLAAARGPAQTVASDMPRLIYYAGLPPPPPRRIGSAELLELAAAPGCGFVALKAGRTPLPPDALRRLGYRREPAPADLQDHPRRSEIELYVR